MSPSEPSSVDSTDTNYRYAAYANRIRTILLSAHRYVAYTSDIGESFRPVAHPWLVRSAYGISWAYLIGDVSHEGYKAYLRNRRALVPPGETYRDASELPQDQIIRGMATGNIAGPLNGEQEEKDKELTPWAETEISLAEDYRMVMAKRAVFQGLASMGLPAFTIHSVVKYSGKMVRGAKSTLMRTWLPIGVCLFLSSFFFSSSCSCACALGVGGANEYSSSVSRLFLPCLISSITLWKKQSTGHSALRCAYTAARMPFVLCPTMLTTVLMHKEPLLRPLNCPGKSSRLSAKKRERSDSRLVGLLFRAGWGTWLVRARIRRIKMEGSDVMRFGTSPIPGFSFLSTVISLLSFLVYTYLPLLIHRYPISFPLLVL